MNQTHEKKESAIAVLFGGRSSEHEISLRSALHILKNIPIKYNIIPVAITRDGLFQSLTGNFTSQDFKNITTQDLALIVDGKGLSSFPQSKNVKSLFYPIQNKYLFQENNHSFRNLNAETLSVFPVLHGPNGEDGRLQALFELAEIPYVGCDIRASVVGIDKDIQKRLVRAAGIPVAQYETVELDEFEQNKQQVLQKIENTINYPCFIKPNALGSAVGSGKAKNRAELEQKLTSALCFDSKALVEELLVGTEVECGFLGTPALPRVTTAGEIATENFYSYEEKYSDSSQAKLFVPARLDDKRMTELKESAKKVAKILGIQGFARIDFWNIPSRNIFIFNEINTCPGLTSISMFPKLWEYEGVGAAQWIEELIERSFYFHKLRIRVEYGLNPAH